MAKSSTSNWIARNETVPFLRKRFLFRQKIGCVNRQAFCWLLAGCLLCGTACNSKSAKQQEEEAEKARVSEEANKQAIERHQERVKQEEQEREQRERVRRMAFSFYKLPALPVKVIYKGNEVATFDRLGQSAPDSVTVPVGELADPNLVKVLVLTPDGWENLPTGSEDKRYPNLINVYPENRLRIGTVLTMTWEETKEYLVRVRIDNRSLEATEVACGELRCSVQANWVGNLTWPQPKKASSAVIRIGGKEVGAIWPLKTDFLIDVSGKRAYRWRKVFYGISTFVGKEPQGELRGNFVYELPSYPDFFLEAAPRQIKTSSISGITERVELLEIQ